MQVFSNNVDTTLSATLTIAATTATVADGSGLRTLSFGQYELLTLTDGTLYEIVKITGRTGNTLTIVRAQESTTAREWASGTRAFADVTAGSITNRLFVLPPTSTPGGLNSLTIQQIRADDQQVASGESATAIGDRTRADGLESMAIGYSTTARKDYSISLGIRNSAEGPNTLCVGRSSYTGEKADGSVAIGYEAQAIAASTIGISAVPAALHYAWGENANLIPSSGTEFAGPEQGITLPFVISAQINLKTLQTWTMPALAGVVFLVDEVGFVALTSTTLTVDPVVSFGTTGDNTLFLNGQTVTGLSAKNRRKRFSTLLDDRGVETLTVTVGTAATATALTARVYWKGWAVVDESYDPWLS